MISTPKVAPGSAAWPTSASTARPCDRLPEETLTPCAGLNAYQVARSTAGVEALVRHEKSACSVPARWVGTRVTVDAGDNVIVIRAKDLIVAEHGVATAAGQRIGSPVPARERWERSVPTLVPPPPKGCPITFSATVQVRPPAVYAEVSA